MVLEWYSYSLYGLFAPILAHIYFPTKDQLLSLMLVFVSYAAGFIAAPIGAIVFGHLGDRHGRQYVLIRAISIMAIATGLIAILPSYNQIGVIAPITLTLLLMMQGFAVSGEDNASIITLIETFPARYRALLGSAAGTASGIGIFLSCITGIIVTNPHLPANCWRIAFAIGLILGVVGLILRIKSFESPIFLKLQLNREIEKIPALTLIRREKSAFIRAIGVSWLQATGVTINAVFMSSYLVSTQHWSMHHAMSLSSLSLMIAIVLTPLIGLLASHIGMKKVMLFAAGFSLISAYPFYALIQMHNTFITAVIVLLANMITVCYVAPASAYVCNLFPPRVRFSGVAIASTIAWVLFGGFIPFTATFLIHVTQNAISPCLLIIVASLCSFITLLLTKNHQLYTDH